MHSLKSLNDFKIETRNGIYKSKEYQIGDTCIVKMGDLYEHRILDGTTTEFEKWDITEDELKKLSLKNKDLLFGRTSVKAEGVGLCSIVNNLTKPLVFDSNIIRLRIEDNGVMPTFLFYFFNSPQGRDKVRSISSGVAVFAIRGSELMKIKLPIPHKSMQTVIVDIISKYDLLIRNNNQRIKILEEMAQTIYTEWFVNFRFPGHKNVKFVDSELGKIPEGWEIENVGNKFKVVLGGTPSTTREEFWSGDIPWINSGKVNELRIINCSEYITKLGLESSSTKMMPRRTTVIAITGATLGQVSLTELELCEIGRAHV